MRTYVRFEPKVTNALKGGRKGALQPFRVVMTLCTVHWLSFVHGPKFFSVLRD